MCWNYGCLQHYLNHLCNSIMMPKKICKEELKTLITCSTSDHFYGNWEEYFLEMAMWKPVYFKTEILILAWFVTYQQITQNLKMQIMIISNPQYNKTYQQITQNLKMQIMTIPNPRYNKVSGTCFHQTGTLTWTWSGTQLSFPLILQFDFPNYLHFHLLAVYYNTIPSFFSPYSYFIMVNCFLKNNFNLKKSYHKLL